MAKKINKKTPKIIEKKLSGDKKLLSDCLVHLSHCRYFNSIPEHNLKPVLASGVYLEAPAGTQLIREGHPDDDIYILLEGALKVSSGQKVVLRLGSPGDVVGEFAVVSNEPRSADVFTEMDSRLVRVSSAVAKADPHTKDVVAQFLTLFSHIMAAKLVETTSRARLYEETVLEAQELATSHEKLQEDIQDKLHQITLYSRIIETGYDAVIITDVDGRIVNINPAAGVLFPELQENARGYLLDLVALFDLGDYESVPADKPWLGEWTRPGKPGKEPLVLQVTVTPILGERKELLNIAHQLRDISLEKSQERAIAAKNEEIQKALVDLESTYQELQKNDRLKSETLTVIADELGGPVRKMANYTEQFVQEITALPGVESSANLLGIQEQITYLRAMSENISNLIDIQQNYQAFSADLFDLKDVFTELVDELLPLATRKLIDFNLKFPAGEMEFTGDRRQIKMVVSLLLEQTIIVGNQASVVDVTGELLAGSSQIHLKIAYQGPTLSNLRPKEGTGGGRFGLLIGLPLARKVVSHYQGSLQILGDSKEGLISILLPQSRKAGMDRASRIFVVDEQDMDRLIVQGVLEHLWPDAVVYSTADPFEFLDNYEDFKPDLVILDPFFKGNGWSNHRIVGSLVTNRRHVCPVLSLSTLYRDFSERSIAVERGVSDFLEKPYSIFDLRFKIKTLLQSHRKEESLHHTMDMAQRQAHTDGLTKLANRKHFDGFLETQVKYALETGKPCSLIMLDIDNFKHYNDTHGHQMGDEVLKSVARLLAGNVRSSDLAARYGGEEFTLVLPETTKDLAAVVAEKVRRAIQEADLPKANEQPLGFMSASFGVSSTADGISTPEDLIRAADEGLYLAKDHGRNQVYVSPGKTPPEKADKKKGSSTKAS